MIEVPHGLEWWPARFRARAPPRAAARLGHRPRVGGGCLGRRGPGGPRRVRLLARGGV